ncbi:hypothetical protein BKA65DRAFT_521493 [Rhexocercosporidium sp. MPI-PUGE-AT-0058]|nr:hypothetical protein BKA65DRAFT_521493 [Rhexocercosporidium sp. MPI-PUGE-AT-0058]
MQSTRSFIQTGFDEALIGCIFSELDAVSVDPLQDYLALSLTCTLFYRIVQPFLYRRVSWRLNLNPNPEYEPKGFRNLQRIMAKPQRAALVRHFSIWKSPYGNRESLLQWLHLSEASDTATHIARVKRFLHDADIPEDWLTRNLDFEVFGALLLTRFTKLEELDIYTWDFSDGDTRQLRSRRHGVFHEVLEAIITPREKRPDTVSTLDRLNTIRIHIDVCDNGHKGTSFLHEPLISFDTISRIFYLPNVCTIQLERIWAEQDTYWPLGIPTAKNLRILILQECDFNARQLQMVLQTTRCLVEFECHILMDANYLSEWFDMEIVKKSLLPMRSSLRHLDFKLDLYTSTAIDIGNPGAWGVNGSLGSMVEFADLSYISICWPALLGWKVEGSAELEKVLPSSLRTLHLTNEMDFWYGYQWDDEEAEDTHPLWHTIVSKLTRYMLSRPPSLEQISLTFSQEYEDDKAMKVHDMLVSTGRSVNIKVHVNIVTR